MIGTGGIGAITAITLSKMGIEELHIWDPDIVSEENIATQFLTPTSLGFHKVTDVGNSISEFSDETAVKMFVKRVNRDTKLSYSPVIVSAVDTINARKEIWEAVKGKFVWYLDARMSAEEFQLYTVKPGSDWYETFIHSLDESDVPELPCTEKATIYTAAMAAGWIGAAVKSYVTDRSFPKILVHNIGNATILKVD